MAQIQNYGDATDQHKGSGQESVVRKGTYAKAFLIKRQVAAVLTVNKL